MKFLTISFLLLHSITAFSQSYYANITDFFTYQNRIEIFDTSQSAPRITISSTPNSTVDDARITKDGYFAYKGGLDGVSDAYYLLDERFNKVDSVIHPKTGNGYENIDGHCIYKDDSLTIYVLEKIIPLSTTVFLQDIGQVNYVLDNLIIVNKNGSIVLESGCWGKFMPKLLLAAAIDTILTWDVAHLNSVDWDGTGIIVSSRCYGIYKIDILGNVVWEQDSLEFNGPIPTQQHDLQYLGNGQYSLFSNGDNSNPMFAATFHFQNDTVVYDYMHQPRLIPSQSMGNFQYNGIINYGAHQSKFIFPDSSFQHKLKPNEYAYRAEMHQLTIAADIIHTGDSLVYLPLNEYSSYTWSTGDIGNYITYTADTVSVTEITPDGFTVYTERVFGPLQGIPNPIKNTSENNLPSYNTLGQPTQPKGLFIRNRKLFVSPN